MEFVSDPTVNKLILLYVFDRMEIPLTEATVVEMCTSRNKWLTYMDCMQAINDLLQADFIYATVDNRASFFTLTPPGRICLAHFYSRIPTSLRAEIVEFIKENRMAYRRHQEYFRDYYRNNDGTYTVHLKINDPIQPVLEIKLNVGSRSTAKSIYNKWEEKAAQVFSNLHELLID